MYFTDAALHNAFIARSMVGIDETKVEYMLNVIHNLCGRLKLFSKKALCGARGQGSSSKMVVWF